MNKMEKNKKPERLREWLLLTLLYQQKKMLRDGKRFARKIYNMFKQHTEMELKRYGKRKDTIS